MRHQGESMNISAGDRHHVICEGTYWLSLRWRREKMKKMDQEMEEVFEMKVVEK